MVDLKMILNRAMKRYKLSPSDAKFMTQVVFTPTQNRIKEVGYLYVEVTY